MADGDDTVIVASVPDGDDRIDAVIALSRLNQATLGQLPYKVFHSAAQNGWIIGAWDGEALAGYIMFRPRKRDGVIVITHLCVADTSRRRGVAKLLVDALNTSRPYAPGMILSCRADYPANDRWPALGFDRLGRKIGKSKHGHELIRWWRPINQQTLFTYVAESEPVPAAALDTDVFRDIVEPREKFLDSIALDADWLTEFVELTTTAQLGTEIEIATPSNPCLRGTATRYRLLVATPAQWEPIQVELDRVVPGAAVGEADKRNMAQAAAGGAAYFVTRDRAILSKAGLRISGWSDGVEQCPVGLAGVEQ